MSEIEDVVANLGKKYGAERIWLFGSYARGDMTEDSDLDFRIDKGSIRELQLAGLLLELEELTDDFRARHPAIPWRQIKAMRNIVAHQYGSVDAATTWEIIKGDIPEFQGIFVKSVVGISTLTFGKTHNCIFSDAGV